MRCLAMMLLYMAGVCLLFTSSNGRSLTPTTFIPTKHTTLNVSNQTGLTFTLLHRDHPIIQSRLLKPNSFSSIEDSGNLSLYYIEFQAGTPAERVQGYFDTGSSFIWFNYSKRNKTSSSLRLLSCHSSDCTEDVPSHGCAAPYQLCGYKQPYLDNSSSSGVVGTDTFAIHETGGHDPFRRIEFQMLFGISDPRDTRLGIVGLNGRLGLLATLQTAKFSICFPVSTLEKSYARFGKDAVLSGDATPLAMDDKNHPNVLVQSIELPGMAIYHLCSAEIRYCSFIVDTGAEFTYLNQYGMDSLITVVKQFVKAEPYEGTYGSFELCYHTRDREALEELELSFTFPPKVSLPLYFDSIWKHIIGKNDDLHCLAFMRSKGIRILGVRQMHGFNFGFDYPRRRLYVQADDCST